MSLMNKLQRAGFIASLALLASVAMASDPKPANVLLGEAQAKAKLEKKNVLVVFDASW